MLLYHVPIWSDVSQNEFKVKYSFSFVDEIFVQDNNIGMASLDVDAFCTNIPLDETIDIFINKLFPNSETLIISKNDFCNLLNFSTKELFLTLNNKLYIQMDSVKIGSPLGSVLANMFL